MKVTAEISNALAAWARLQKKRERTDEARIKALDVHRSCLTEIETMEGELFKNVPVGEHFIQEGQTFFQIKNFRGSPASITIVAVNRYGR